MKQKIGAPKGRQLYGAPKGATIMPNMVTKQASCVPNDTCCKGAQSIPRGCKLLLSARHFVCIFFLNVDIILCKCFSILCACKKFMCCEELFSKRPVHSLYAYVQKNLPLYTPKPQNPTL